MEGQLAKAWPDHWLATLAERQHGVVAWWQLRGIGGISRGAVDSRLARGRLHIVHRGVYAVGHPVLTREGRWMASVLACGPAAVLSHDSAGALWGFRSLSAGAIHVTVPEAGGRARRPGIRIHRSPDAPATEHLGIPVTTPARTLLDLAGRLPRRALEDAVADAERLRLFDLREIEALARNGRPGGTVLLEVARTWDDAPTRSALERRFLQLCADHGLPRPLVNTMVAGLEVDFVWRERRVVVETDSRRHHGSPAAMERDRRRDAALRLAGYHVLRFTWQQVTTEPDVVVAVLRTLLG